MRIVKIGVKIERSIKVADYTYYKPSVYLEAEIDPEQYKYSMAALKEIAEDEIAILELSEAKIYERREKKAKVIRSMKRMKKGSTEYRAAQKDWRNYE